MRREQNAGKESSWQGPTVVDRWLDGEVSLTTLQSAEIGGEPAAIWARITDEVTELRRQEAPEGMVGRIMEALPLKEPVRKSVWRWVVEKFFR